MVLVKKLSNTATAVVDTITEKTPITSANKVRADRTLFDTKESNACDVVSFIFIYSNLNDSMGSDFAARYAGINPKSNPTNVQIVKPRNTTLKFMTATKT